MAKKRKQRREKVIHVSTPRRSGRGWMARLPIQLAPPTGEMFVGLTEGLPINEPPATLENVTAAVRQAERIMYNHNAPEINWQLAPALPDIPDEELLIAADRLEEWGQTALADVLRKLPHDNQFLSDGKPVCHAEWWVRCHGGPLHFGLASLNRLPGLWPQTETHHYVLKTAIFRGLTLRWYQWEERPKVDEEKLRQASPRDLMQHYQEMDRLFWGA